MPTQVIQVIPGKHLVYKIVKRTSLVFDTEYYVRISNGKVSGSFRRLDRAVQWVHEQARHR